MKEFLKLSQSPGIFRRLFFGDDFDLYIWYQNQFDSKIIGFQFVFDKNEMKIAFTWTEEKGFFSSGILEEESFSTNKTPILIELTEYKIEDFLREFIEKIENEDKFDGKFIAEKLHEYLTKR